MSAPVPAPCFSVVIPAYNAEAYLAQALDSVLAQTLADWEMIVVDDASSDGTPGILARYAAKNPAIRIFRNEENSGAGKVNRGIREARGVWIVRLDADDLFTPDYLSTLQASIAQLPHPECFLSSWATIIDGQGGKVLDVRLPSGKKITQMMDVENFLYHSGTSFRKEAWAKVGGYPDDRSQPEDAELWKALLRAGASLVMIPRNLVLYRIHDTNFTSFKDGSFVADEDHSRAPGRHYHEWRISLFLKQGEFQAARDEIALLKVTHPGYSLKNAYYYLMTFLPKPFVHAFMWELRPRLRRWIKSLAAGPFRPPHQPA